MANAIRMFVGAILFSAASELSSRFLEKSAAGDWVDLALYIGLTGFMLSQIVLSIPQSQNNSTPAYE